MSKEAEKFRTGKFHAESGVRTILYRPGEKYIHYVNVDCESGVHKLTKDQERYIRPAILSAGTKRKQYPVRKLALRLKRRLRDNGIKPSKNVQEFLDQAAAQYIDISEDV